jgi:hypothetical protein
MMMKLFHQVGQIWQNSQVACAFNSSGYTALVFEAVTRDSARQQLALFVDKLQQEVGVLVINMLEAKFAETAVFFCTQPDFRIAEKFNVFSGSSHNSGKK